MDAPRGMNEHEADRALRDLFREAGGLQAPEGLEARVMQRLAAMPRNAAIPEKPLLPKWSLFTAAALFAGLLVASFRMGGTSSSLLERFVPPGVVKHVLGSPWLVMALASSAALFALHTWLNERLRSAGAH